MMKLLPQLDIVPYAQPFARSEDGKISAGIAQGIGPLRYKVSENSLSQERLSTYHVAPKVSIKNNKKATLVHAAD